MMAVAGTTTAPHVVRRPSWIRRLADERVGLVCLLVLAAIAGAALAAPLLGLHDPMQPISNRLLPVGSPGHLLGTDELGRDMLSRLVHGGRLSLAISFTPVLLAFVIGTLLGVTAGYSGGWINSAIMRTVDVFYAFPSVLLAVAIAGALGAGITNVIVALTLVFTPPICRVAESVTAQVRGLEFIDAARLSGAGRGRIIAVHVLRNTLPPVVVYATGLLSVAMILGSGLSFLGLGVRPPQPEWGLMLNTLRTALYTQPAVAVLPGVFIFIVSLSANMAADALRAAAVTR